MARGPHSPTRGQASPRRRRPLPGEPPAGQGRTGTGSPARNGPGSGSRRPRQRPTPPNRSKLPPAATRRGRGTPRGPPRTFWPALPGSLKAGAAGHSPLLPPPTTGPPGSSGAGSRHRRRLGRDCAPLRCCWPRLGSSAAVRTPSCSRCSPSSPLCPTPSPGCGKPKTGPPKLPPPAAPPSSCASPLASGPARATGCRARRQLRPAGRRCPSTSAGPGPDPPKAQPGRTADVAVRAGCETVAAPETGCECCCQGGLLAEASVTGARCCVYGCCCPCLPVRC